MKKRFLAILCALALLLSLNLPFAQAANYDYIYFMAVNETLYPIMSLTDDSMPVVSGGVLYVPYTMFDASYTGVALGVYYNYSRQLGTFTIYDRQRMLVFDINGGNCADRDTTYSARVIARNGKIYVPVSFVCDFFGLTCTTFPVVLTGGTVNMVRVCNSLASMEDAFFASAATFGMNKPLSDYLRSKEVAASPTIPVTPAVTNPPAVSPSPQVDGKEETHQGTTVRLAFRCTDGQGFPAILRSLELSGASATFYFRPDDLAERDGDVRDLIARGHQVGLLLDEKNAENDFVRGNRLLSHIARMNTRTVCFPAGTTGEGNWSLWRDNTGEVMSGITGSAQLTRKALKVLDQKKGVARLTLDDSLLTTGALPSLLSTLSKNQYIIALR
ncbi:MAG: hypothetical protein RRY64_05535 [Oscillospiraceae bacterium]